MVVWGQTVKIGSFTLMKPTICTNSINFEMYVFQISFNVTVKADTCIKNTSFTIRPRGIKDTLTVILSTNCECECNDTEDKSHSHCSFKGKINCGMCR